MFQWYFGEDAISGATQRTYELPDLLLSNAGDYSCYVTDDMGSPGDPGDDETIVSEVAQIEIAPHIEIVTPPEGGIKHTRNSHVFSVTVTGGYEPLEYQWSKNGQIIPDATSPTYSMLRLEASDSGIYIVEISDSNTDVIQSPGADLEVLEDLPALSLLALGLLAGLCMLGGALTVRKKT